MCRNILKNHGRITRQSNSLQPSASARLAWRLAVVCGVKCVTDSMKAIIDISTLTEMEKDIYLKDSWCSKCQEADLGIVSPELYLEDGRKYISGNCKVCGEICVSEIIEKQVGN